MKNKAAQSKAWTTLQIARHPERPQFLDYVSEIFTEFDALQLEFFIKEASESVIHYWGIDINNNQLEFWEDMQVVIDLFMRSPNLDLQSKLNYSYYKKGQIPTIDHYLQKYGPEEYKLEVESKLKEIEKLRQSIDEGLHTKQSRNHKDKKWFTSNGEIYLKVANKRFLEIYITQEDELLYGFEFNSEILNIACNERGTLFAVSTGKKVYIFTTALEIVKTSQD